MPEWQRMSKYFTFNWFSLVCASFSSTLSNSILLVRVEFVLVICESSACMVATCDLVLVACSCRRILICSSMSLSSLVVSDNYMYQHQNLAVVTEKTIWFGNPISV